MKPVRLLLVEDHAVFRLGTRDLLAAHADLRIVGEAADGGTAVRLADKLHPQIILMDIALPGLSGIEATKQIKARHPEIAVLILTGYDDEEYVEALLEVGVAGYLLKSASPQELVNAIRAVSSGESVLHPAVVRRLLTSRGRTSPPPPVPESPPVERQVDDLTPREVEILRLAATGANSKQMGRDLGISARTVQAHLYNIFSKLGVASRTEAVLCGLKRGWLKLEDLPGG
ncbi:MAG: response regulator transcription factor [Deinococcus sp.]|nr:response regulator transcription factor [Deinococcus sp.]